MAKAVLRRAKILLLDEGEYIRSFILIFFLSTATSSIDTKTDALIQKLLREEFSGSTIICIAHRINTVLDFDKILVMDEGKAVEFGPPDILRARRNSLFGMLCR